MAVLSLLVLVGITSLFVTPTTTAFATTLATSRVASRQEVFYGTISASGAPDAKVLVVAYHYRGKLKVHDLSVATSPSGSYRLSLPAGTGPEYIEFFKGKVKTSLGVMLHPGEGFELNGIYSAGRFVMKVTASQISLQQEVFYGSVVTPSGAPDAKVLVVAYHYRGKLKVHDLSVATSPSGSYRLSLPAGNRPEYVEFFKGRTMTSVRVILRPGTAYKISGRLVVKRFLFYLPVFSY
jgi:hypothetical protein